LQRKPIKTNWNINICKVCNILEKPYKVLFDPPYSLDKSKWVYYLSLYSHKHIVYNLKEGSKEKIQHWESNGRNGHGYNYC